VSDYFTKSIKTKVAELFMRGASLDRISEIGLHEGWTREQAKEVVIDRRWSLDWQGRLQPQYLAHHATDSATLSKPLSEATAEEMLLVGLESADRSVRVNASLAQESIEALRRALFREQEKAAKAAATEEKAS
jgi:hypothetical protein